MWNSIVEFQIAKHQTLVRQSPVTVMDTTDTPVRKRTAVSKSTMYTVNNSGREQYASAHDSDGCMGGPGKELCCLAFFQTHQQETATHMAWGIESKRMVGKGLYLLD
jgi:hypothetical protein